jgi:hypothetical protein
MGKQDRDSRNETDHIETEVPKAHQIADFPGVEKINVTKDFSKENPSDVIDPHPGLKYRLINAPRKGRRAKAKAMGYLPNPPNKHGEIAQTVGDNEGQELWACTREVFDARTKVKGDAAKAKSDAMTADAVRKARAAGGKMVDAVIKRTGIDR